MLNNHRMLELVFANLKVRPFRTLISVIGVALGVVLVVLFTGLARGMTNDMAHRASNWKAEIVFTRPGAMDTTSAATSAQHRVRCKTARDRRRAVDSSCHPLYHADTKGRWGIQQLDGVDWEPFAAMNDMQLVGPCSRGERRDHSRRTSDARRQGKFGRRDRACSAANLQGRRRFRTAIGFAHQNVARRDAGRARDTQLHVHPCKTKGRLRPERGRRTHQSSSSGQ